MADTGAATIRKVTPVGTNWVVTTLAGWFDHYLFQNGTGTNAWFNLPASVAVDSAGNVYVADIFNHVIRKVTPARVVTTLGGMAGFSPGRRSQAIFPLIPQSKECGHGPWGGREERR